MLIFPVFRFFSFFSVCFGLVRNSSVCLGCFDIGSKHRNKPNFFVFGFTKTNRNKRETDLVSVCFGSNQNLYLFVSRTPYLEVTVMKKNYSKGAWGGGGGGGHVFQTSIPGRKHRGGE